MSMLVYFCFFFYSLFDRLHRNRIIGKNEQQHKEIKEKKRCWHLWRLCGIVDAFVAFKSERKINLNFMRCKII